MLFFWFWEKQKVLATVKTSNLHNPVTQVSYSYCLSGAIALVYADMNAFCML